MVEKNAVGFFEEWQTGAFFVLASALVGAVVGGLVGSSGSGYLGFIGFFAGAVLAFLIVSYLRYGR